MDYQSMKMLQANKAQFVRLNCLKPAFHQELSVKLLLESELPLTKAPHITRQSK